MASAESASATAPAWRDAAWLAVVSLSAFCLLALRPQVGSDMRYGEACWEMVHGSGWLVPHLCYVPYVEKPILIYWLGACSQLLFGSSPLATQLPSALASCASVVLTYWWARLSQSRAIALLAALCLLGSGLFLTMGSILTTDPLLAMLVTAAFAAFAAEERQPGRGWIWGFWLAAAGGALAKGPLAWVLIGCGIAPYLALSRPPLQALRAVVAMRPLSGLAVLLAVNLPWWWAMWRVDPRYLEFFFLRINLQGLVDPNVNHPGPPWFYLGIIAAGLLPLALVLLPALLVRLARLVKEEHAGGLAWAAPPGPLPRSILYLACTALGPLFFLSASASKLPAYILPVLPQLLLLAALVLQEWLERPPRWTRWVLWAQAVALVLATIGYLRFGLHDEVVAPLGVAALMLGVTALELLALGMAVAAALARAGRLDRALLALGAGGLAAGVVGGPFVADLRMTSNAEPLAEQVVARRQPGDQVVVASDLCQDYEIIGHLRQRFIIYGPARELGMGHFTEATPSDQPLPPNPDDVSGELLQSDPWLISEHELAVRWRGGPRIWLFAGDDSIASQLRRDCLQVIEAGRTRKAVLLTNYQPDSLQDLPGSPGPGFQHSYATLADAPAGGARP